LAVSKTVFIYRIKGVSSPINLKIGDEAMTAWKGWFISKVCMLNKPGTYDIKVYLVSVSTSEYLCNMEV
jgi:hypothetical protein